MSRIIATLVAAELPEVIVVTGAAPEATHAAWQQRDARVHFVQNPDWQSGQLSSLLTGLNAPSVVPIEAALVTLVDVPLVTVVTVKVLLHTWRQTRAPLVRPARMSLQATEEHGHPVIFDASLFDELRAADPTTGAKPVVRAHSQEIINLPVSDAGAFLDIDTPEAYAQLLREAEPLR